MLRNMTQRVLHFFRLKIKVHMIHPIREMSIWKYIHILFIEVVTINILQERKSKMDIMFDIKRKANII